MTDRDTSEEDALRARRAQLRLDASVERVIEHFNEEVQLRDPSFVPLSPHDGVITRALVRAILEEIRR